MAKKVLVIDHDPGTLLAMADFIRRQGHSVSTAQEFLGAVGTLVNDECYDLVISSFRIDKEGNGLDLLRFMRRREKYRHTPAVLTNWEETAEEGELDLEKEAQSIGAEFWVKPVFDIDDYVNRLLGVE